MTDRVHRRLLVLAAPLLVSVLGMTLGVQGAAAEGVLPEVLAETATNVQTTTATLNGSVNPEGVAVTSCRFEYGTVPPPLPPFSGYAEYNHEVPCTPQPGSGSSAEAVSAQIAGLQPNTYYFYRVTAANANGANTSASGELITPGPPVLESESVVKIGYSTATLRAEINPEDLATTYQFEYGQTAAYGESVPAAGGQLVAARESQQVGEPLTNLKPGITYHYRLVTTNAIGTTDGPDQTFTTFASVASGLAEGCPNATLRDSGLSENLPDCRAYELVSPVDKNDADVIGQDDTNLAAASGNAVLFASHNSFANTRGSGVAGLNQYIATRGASAWETNAIMPTPARSAVQIFYGATVAYLFSTELGFAGLTAQQLPEAEGGVPNGEDLYREDTVTGRLQTVTNPRETEVSDPFALSGGGGITGGSAEDLSVIAFQSTANFLPQATGSDMKLYASNQGTLELAGVLPNGTIPPGGSTSVRPSAFESRQLANSVSADGSRIFFMAPADESTPPQLYMREDGARTVWVSQSEASTPNPEPRGVKFQAASADGNEVVFSSADALLNDDPGGEGYGLYLYKASPHPDAESNLIFVGRYSEEPKVLGTSADEQVIYFKAGSTLYVWDNGTVRAITTHFGSNFANFENVETNVLSASANGERVAFIAGTEDDVLTGPASRGSHTEMYVYEAPTQTLRCVSCPGNGAAALGSIEVEPHATEFGVGIGFPVPHRFMSSDGRYVFFSTDEALVPQDTNGLTDVYEYDLETGSIALISSGTGDRGAWFVEASASGDDVFFVTQQSYSRADTDNLVDLYDARVDGGLPEPAPSPVPCAGDACQGTPAGVPSFNTASGFSGLGNVTPTPVVKPKRKGKPKKHATGKRKAAKKHRAKRHVRRKSKVAHKRASHRSGR